MKATKPKSQIVLINYYRGFAAASVLFYHVAVEVKNRFFDTHYYNIFKVTSFGVDFFFVLSGFIIFYIHKKDIAHRDKLITFLRKRVIRIFPIYWILLTLALIVFVLTKTNVSRESVYMTLPFILRSYFLFPIAAPILTPAWTLSYEVFFYAIFSLLIFLKQTKLVVTILILYSVSLLSLNFIFGRPEFFIKSLDGWLNVFTSPLIIEFMFGAVAGYLFFKLPTISSKTAKLLIFASMFFLLFDWIFELSVPFWDTKYRMFTFALPSGLLLLSSAKFEQRRQIVPHKVLNFLGNASYSIYLAQAFLLLVFFKIIFLYHFPVNKVTIPLFALGAILFTLILSGMFHFFIEKKILQRLQH